MSDTTDLIQRLKAFRGLWLGDGMHPSVERQKVIDALEQQAAQTTELQDLLIRNGFVRCDIPACNCGSWHARYGLPERMQEIKSALSEAGHELCNANGNLVLRALQELIAERDQQAEQIEALRADAERMRADLISCRGTVKTERHHYERLSMVHGKTPHGECYWAEAKRLGDLLDRIDSLAAIDAALRQEQEGTNG